MKKTSVQKNKKAKKAVVKQNKSAPLKKKKKAPAAKKATKLSKAKTKVKSKVAPAKNLVAKKIVKAPQAKAKKKDTTDRLTELIILGIQEKKGKDIVCLDLKNIENAVCNYFIVCHADSNTQVNAIADSVYDVVKKASGEFPWHKEGFQNAEWVLLDYSNVVVHIFQKEIREYYNLEKLWADAKIRKIA